MEKTQRPPKPDTVPVSARYSRRDKTTQTAVHTFRHPSGRTVTLVGVHHTGPQAYWDQLRPIIGALEAGGATVYYELIMVEEDLEQRAVTEAEREAVRVMLDGQRHDRLNRTPRPGWIYQYAGGLAVDKRWVHVDVDMLDLIRVLGPDYIRHRYGSHPAPALQRAARVGWWARFQVRVQSRVMHLTPWRGFGGVPAWFDELVYCRWRSLVAGAAVMAETGDAVMIWGVPHLNELGQILLNNRFTVVDTQWVTLADWRVERPAILERMKAAQRQSP